MNYLGEGFINGFDSFDESEDDCVIWKLKNLDAWWKRVYVSHKEIGREVGRVQSLKELRSEEVQDERCWN